MSGLPPPKLRDGLWLVLPALLHLIDGESGTDIVFPFESHGRTACRGVQDLNPDEDDGVVGVIVHAEGYTSGVN